jgi:uncharacterized protein (DUF362 family)
MVYDLNLILQYVDKNGKIQKKPQRKYFSIIDGIIGGERFGPLNSTPKKVGVLIGGEDPVLVEYVGTRIMGFDENKVKTLNNINKISHKIGETDFDKVIICTNNEKWNSLKTSPSKVCFKFIPAPGWKGHIELK